MKQECKTHLIPTEEITGIVLHGSGLDPFYNTNKTLGYHEAVYAVNNIGGTYQHLYITDDSKIEEGDWYIHPNGTSISQCGSDKNTGDAERNASRKVIATTDKSLTIKHQHDALPDWNLPQIPQDFIKQYCENPCDSVMVEYELDNDLYENHAGDDRYSLKLTENNCIIISPIEEKMYSYEQVVKAYEEGVSQGMGWGNGDAHKWIKENL